MLTEVKDGRRQHGIRATFGHTVCQMLQLAHSPSAPGAQLANGSTLS